MHAVAGRAWIGRASGRRVADLSAAARVCFAKNRDDRYRTCQALSDHAGIAELATPDVEIRPDRPALDAEPPDEHTLLDHQARPTGDADHPVTTDDRDSTAWWRRRSSIHAATHSWWSCPRP